MSDRLIAPLLLVATMACGGAVRDDDTTRVARGCGYDSTSRITSDGIADLQIGSQAAEVHHLCEVVSDSSEMGTEGQPQRVMRVRLGASIVAAEIVEQRVWRLAVGDTAYRTADGVGVGTALEALIAGDRFSGANGETGVFVFVARHCGLSFRLDGKAPGFPASLVVSDDPMLQRVPPDTPVDQVLIVGRRNAYCVPPATG